MRPNPMPDLRSTLRGVLEKALQETGGVRGSIVLVDPTHGDLVILEKSDPQGPWPPPPNQKVRLHFHVGEGIAGRVALTGQPYYAPLASEDPHFISPQVLRTGNWSLLAVPIIAESGTEPRTIGVISIEGPEDHRDFFDARAQNVLSNLADEAVASIEAASLSALVQATLSSYRLKRILAVSQAVVSQQSLEAILQEIAKIAFEELRADVLTLYRWDVETQDFITPPIKLGEFRYPEAMGAQIHKGDVVDEVFHEWGSQFFFTAQQDPKLLSLGAVPSRDGQAGRERFSVREGITSSAILRLEVGRKRVGVLCVNWRTPHPFDDAERAVLEIFANHVAIAIESDRLTRLAVTEATTAQRKRLHRDLHDEVGARLNGIKHHTAAAKNLLAAGDYGEAAARLQDIERVAAAAFKGVRDLLMDLEPSIEPDLRKALHEFCTDHSSVQCRVFLTVIGLVDQLRAVLPEGVFRIAREAVINAQRHGEASHIWVDLRVTPDELWLGVKDDGCGGQIPSLTERQHDHNFGITIMEQRTSTLGGHLEIAASPDTTGWLVILTIAAPCCDLGN